MKVLIACEESQEVCKAFRARGHEAYSCDIAECSGGHPEWHIQDDVLRILNGYKRGYGCPWFTTCDGITHETPERWDLIIAHPPCTYLTVTANRFYNVERYGDKALKRLADREDAAEFFMEFVTADCDRIAIENPVGVMGSRYRKCDQVIQPWMFGESTVKKTCLWLKGLPKLNPTCIVETDPNDVYSYVSKTGRIKHDSRRRSRCKSSDRARHRSKTFPGIAKAMAEQWG